jgi:translation initiation factor IF-3
MDYGKWKYSQKKNIKKHHEQQTKEVRLRPKTDTHDREIKLRQAVKFFQRGDRVQFTMVFRGRERLRREIALDVFRALLDELGQRVKVERPPSMDGRHMVMVLSAVKDAFGPSAASDGASKPPGETRSAAKPAAAGAPALPTPAPAQPSPSVAPPTG